MLTRKQLDLLNYINKHLNKDGIPPSFDEMKEALDLRSKSGIHRLITALEERGFIRRLAHRARAIILERNGIPAAATPRPPVRAVAVNKNFLRSLSKPLSFFDINFLLRNANSEL